MKENAPNKAESAAPVAPSAPLHLGWALAALLALGVLCVILGSLPWR